MSQEKGKANRMVGVNNSGFGKRRNGNSESLRVRDSIIAPIKTKPTKEKPNKPKN